MVYTCTLTTQVLHWYCIGTELVLVLYWYCADVALGLPCYCTIAGTVLPDLPRQDLLPRRRWRASPIAEPIEGGADLTLSCLYVERYLQPGQRTSFFVVPNPYCCGAGARFRLAAVPDRATARCGGETATSTGRPRQPTTPRPRCRVRQLLSVRRRHAPSQRR